jgi:hypothetical protein
MLNITNNGISKLSRAYILNTAYHSGIPYFLDHKTHLSPGKYHTRIKFAFNFWYTGVPI